MSKAKKAKKTIKDEGEATEKLLDYMTRQNRPFNATDLYQNLHHLIGKTLITRLLVKMAGDGLLVEKVYGKQKIYFVAQSRYEKMSKEELAEKDREINALRNDTKAKTQAVNALKSELSSLLSSPETEDAKKQLAELKKENSAKEAKLKKLRESGESISEETKTAINKKYKQMVKEWRRRRRIAMDILDQILEGYNKPKKKLYAEVGIETDAEAKVNISDFST